MKNNLTVFILLISFLTITTYAIKAIQNLDVEQHESTINDEVSKEKNNTEKKLEDNISGLNNKIDIISTDPENKANSRTKENLLEKTGESNNELKNNYEGKDKNKDTSEEEKIVNTESDKANEKQVNLKATVSNTDESIISTNDYRLSNRFERQNAIIEFDGGYRIKEKEELVSYFDEIYTVLTKYYNISNPRKIKISFQSLKEDGGSHTEYPNAFNGQYEESKLVVYKKVSINKIQSVLLHEYTHHFNRMYRNDIPVYMNEGMAFYMEKYYNMSGKNKEQIVDKYVGELDYKGYFDSVYLFLAMEKYLGSNETFPEYFKHLKNNSHEKAFKKAFGVTEDEFEKIYNQM